MCVLVNSLNRFMVIEGIGVRREILSFDFVGSKIRCFLSGFAGRYSQAVRSHMSGLMSDARSRERH